MKRCDLLRAEKRIIEYDCLRVILTLLVIIGHCTYYKINTDYGGCDYSNFVGNSCVIFQMLCKMTNVIYIFHMPLFMVLSGAVFRLSFCGGGEYKSFKHIMLKKGKRLLIPFLLVSVLYSFPLKYLSGYYSSSKSFIKDFFVGQLLVQGNTHLWYVVTLFFVSIIVYCLECNSESFAKKSQIFWRISILFVLSIVSSKIEIQLISYIFQYLFWFYIGYYFESIRNRINKTIQIPSLVCGFIGAIVLYIIYYWVSSQSPFAFRVLSRILKIIVAMVFCLCVYMFSYMISHTRIICSQIFQLIRKDSFGIYLYSDPWNYVFLSIGTLMAGNTIFQNNAGAILFFNMRLWGTLGISIVVSELLRKYHVKLY